MAAHYLAVISMKCLKLGVPTPDWIDWCSKPDLNRHALRQKFLRLSWLPISPFEHITHLCIPTSAASQGFVTIQNSKKYLISPGYKKPANPFIRTKGFGKTTTLVLFIFFSQTSVVVSSYKNRLSCWVEERKVESLSCKLVLLLIFRTEKCLRQKSAEKVLIILLGLKDLQKAGPDEGTRTLRIMILSHTPMPIRLHPEINALLFNGIHRQANHRPWFIFTRNSWLKPRYACVFLGHHRSARQYLKDLTQTKYIFTRYPCLRSRV